MPNISIAKTVGKAGRNQPIDIALIQSLLKNYYTNNKPDKDKSKAEKKFASLVINGKYSSVLETAILNFQTNAVKLPHPDSKVDPGGKTFKTLVSSQATKYQTLSSAIFGAAPTNSGILSGIPTTHFRNYFLKYYGLTTSKGEDFNGFFEMLKKDASIKDIRWAAYILATVYHETTFSFKPRSESGKGVGYGYGKKIQVDDKKGIRGKPGAKYINIYYGRGYVQLTWDYNYKSLGKAIGLGDQLYINPDLVLDKKIAYKITSVGMRKGSFTGDKLGDYISIGKTDYKGARKIINGTDQYKKIASYAETIEMLLRLSSIPTIASTVK